MTTTINAPASAPTPLTGGSVHPTSESQELKPDRRVDARTGEDRLRSGAMAALTSFAFLVSSGALITAGIVINQQDNGTPAASAFVVAAFCLLGSVVAPVAIVSVQRARRKRLEQFKQECEQLDRIVDEIQDPALGKLVSFNFRLTDRFISVALGQAGASFFACSVAASAALLVLLAGAATVLTVDSGRAQITVGLLTAAGTTLSGYLSVTFVHTFEMTSRQMSYYYGQPLVHCYLLHAEWLAARFEADAEASDVPTIRQELITAALSAATNAQDHLLDLQMLTRSNRPLHGRQASNIHGRSGDTKLLRTERPIWPR